MQTSVPIVSLTASRLPTVKVSATRVAAGLVARFVATAIDTLIVGIVAVPAAYYVATLGAPVTFATLTTVLVGAGAFAAINFKRLEASGQTIGKKIAGIRIVGSKGEKLTAEDILILRYAPVWCVALVPVLGGVLLVVNAAMIFGQNRVCGHDLVAKTKVVRA